MNDDQRLLQMLRAAAMDTNHSPEALIALGKDAAHWNLRVVIQANPPRPTNVQVQEITDEQIDQWPEWVADLLQHGSRWERLEWEDRTYTVRLLTPRGRVIAGRVVSSEIEN